MDVGATATGEEDGRALVAPSAEAAAGASSDEPPCSSGRVSGRLEVAAAPAGCDSACGKDGPCVHLRGLGAGGGATGLAPIAMMRTRCANGSAELP